MQNKQKENEKGRSMIEMLGVLAIIGVLSVGGIAGYSKAMYRYRLNKTIEQITQVAGNIRSFFGPQKSFAGLISYCNNTQPCLLKKAKLIPDEMWNSNGRYVTTSLGYTLSIYPYPKSYTSGCRNDTLCNNQALTMSITPTLEICVDLLTQDWSELNVTAFFVQNTRHAQTAKTYYLPAPVDIRDAIKVCQSDDGLIQINMMFDFDYKKGTWKDGVADTRRLLDAMP